ncbi:MAG: hypothetical protein JWP67_1281 [Mucilaginibacter sp.]|nr:hypothetical protein [Mucilaginibacter sp.]
MKKQLLTIAALAAIVFNVHAQQDSSKMKIKKDTVVRSLPSPLPSLPFRVRTGLDHH